MTAKPDIYECFEMAVADHADRPFLWYDDTEYSYAAAADSVEMRAGVLNDLGLVPGDRLGLLLPNDPEFIFLALAAARQGVVTVPFDYRQEHAVLDHLVTDADLSALIVDADVYANFEAVQPVDVGTVITHDVTDGDSVDLDAAVADAGNPGPRPDVHPTDVAVLSYTSGTTGPPKGVYNPHRAFVDAGCRIADACNIDCSDRALLVLPLFHANPMTYGLMTMLSVGGSVAPVRSFSASRFWQDARDSAATYVTHVGSVLEILAQNTDDKTDIDTPLEFAVGGAAQFDAAAFEQQFDLDIVRLYGLSELGAGLVTIVERDPDRDGHVDHQGYVDNCPFEVRVLADDGLDWADPGEYGEIVVRPERPGLMFTGYRGRAEETVADWQDLWMHTGDLGAITEDGALQFAGRTTSTIRRNGEYVSPWSVETAVAEWGAIEEVVAVGVPDPVVGEEIKLYVRPATETLTELAVHNRCSDALPDHLIPRYVALVESIPKTSTQKVERVKLSNRDVDGVWDSHVDGRGGD